MTVKDFMDVFTYDYNDYIAIYDVESDDDLLEDSYTVGQWVRDGKLHENTVIDTVSINDVLRADNITRERCIFFACGMF